MDTGEGVFEVLDDVTDEELAERRSEMELRFPKHGGWFRVGEEVELNGSRFRIKAVKPTELRLKLLKRRS